MCEGMCVCVRMCEFESVKEKRGREGVCVCVCENEGKEGGGLTDPHYPHTSKTLQVSGCCGSRQGIALAGAIKTHLCASVSLWGIEEAWVCSHNAQRQQQPQR